MTKEPTPIETLHHDAAARLNIPTAKYASIMREDDKTPA